MKHIIIILSAFSIAATAAYPQGSGLDGSIRYQFEYTDVLLNNSLLTTKSSSPSIFLLKKGFISSEYFISYAFHTSLSATYQTARASGLVTNTRQFHWNEYDLNVSLLQTAPVKFQLATREYQSGIRLDYEGLRSRTGTRNHQDLANVDLDRVPFLPQVHFTFIRNTSRSIIGSPYEQLSRQYTLSATSRNGTEGHTSVIGTLSDFREKYSGFYERILTLQLDGSQSLAENHVVNIGSEFNKYSGYSSLTGGVGYVGVLSPAVRITTGLSGQNSSSASYSVYSGGISQGIQLTQDEHITWGLGAAAGAGVSTTRRYGAPVRTPSDNWNTGLNVNHIRTLGSFNVSNALTLGYGRTQYRESVTTYRFGASNNANTTIRQFAVNMAYNFSFLRNDNFYSWQSIEHFALLGVNGVLTGTVRSHTTADFRSNNYYGDRVTASDLRVLNLSEALSGSFREVIPFTLTAKGSVHYYYLGLRGHSYGYGGAFQSPRFFLDQLTVAYKYQRSYDPYYRKSTIEHRLDVAYRWRMLSFQLGLLERTVFNRQRDVRFSVERAI